MRRRPTGHPEKPQRAEMLGGLGVKPSTHLSQDAPSLVTEKKKQGPKSELQTPGHTARPSGRSPQLHKARFREEDCLQGPQENKDTENKKGNRTAARQTVSTRPSPQDCGQTPHT